MPKSPKGYDAKAGWMGLDPDTNEYCIFPTEDEYLEYFKEASNENTNKSR